MFLTACAIVIVVKDDDGHLMNPKEIPPGAATPGGLVCLRQTGLVGLCAAIM
uniref:Uncharacterized protein n=1 Tax=uncultured prokaryote TaxID=198431 RepID=A0A0H5PXN2_9ZZZZ|nr:hypothetical protein [uncultured prokaryote]